MSKAHIAVEKSANKTPPADAPPSASGFRELVSCCSPEGTWSLEWRVAEAAPEAASRKLQEALYAAEADDWLVRLAFADRGVALPPSLHFLRGFLGAFADWLRHTPEIETQRTALVCPAPAETLAAACAAVPPMDGGEYVSADTLTLLWDRLVAAIRAQLAAHKGSVASFLQKLNPDIHLAGRVYFHLVENRSGSAAPFAFLATYSQADVATGRVRHVPLAVLSAKRADEHIDSLSDCDAPRSQHAVVCCRASGHLKPNHFILRKGEQQFGYHPALPRR